MKVILALVVLGMGVVFAFVSVVFGALLLSSANGPTQGNWIAHGVFTYAVPAIVLLICIFLLTRIFR